MQTFCEFHFIDVN